jgi:dihydroflavonol-4-reductase
VVITYPGAVFGPHDPHLGDQLQRIRNILKGRSPIAPTGGYPIVDVRDVAKVHAAVLEPGRGPRRYMAGGTYLRYAEPHRAAGGGDQPPAAGGDRAGRAAAARCTGGRADPAHRAGPHPDGVRGRLLRPVRGPVRRHPDASGAGRRPRDIQVTLANSVRWLFEQGNISHRQAGQLATG